MKKINNSALTEVIGTVLLLAITVALFSVLYLLIMPSTAIDSAPSVNIVGFIDDQTVVFEHHGGNSLNIERITNVIKIGGYRYTIPFEVSYFTDINSNNQWDIGEKIYFYAGNLSGLHVEGIVIDEASNTALFIGNLQDGSEQAFPYVITNDASDVTNSSARVAMTYNLWNHSGSIRFTYKPETGNWTNTSWIPKEGISSHTMELDDLTAGIRYYYKAQLEYNSILIEGEEKSFIPTFTIETNVNDFEGYLLYDSSEAITANGSNNLDNITLWYQYSTDNTSWSTEWWNHSFTHRKPIYMNVTTGETPGNYSVFLNVSYEPEMQADFDDIRFIRYNDNESTLDYWIENKSDGGWAKIWVEIRDNITSDNTILAWLYYGNSTVESNSNGTDTFQFFDDFTGTSYDTNKWGTNFESNIEVSNGVLSSWGNWNTGGHYFATHTSFTAPIIVESKARIGSISSDTDLCFGFQNEQTTEWWTNAYCVWCLFDSNGGASSNRKEIKTNGVLDYTGEPTSTDWEVHHIEYLTDGVHWYDSNLGWLNTSRTTYSPFYFSITGDTDSSSIKDYIDYIFIRSYFNGDVSYTIGSEENIDEYAGWRRWEDVSNPDTAAPWSWNFTFPQGTGYYEFYTIGAYAGFEEDTPELADSICYYRDMYDDAVAYWHLDEGAGATISDPVGTYNGVFYGAEWTNGVINYAGSFDGTDYIEIAGFPNLQSDFTITAWVYTTDNSEVGQRIFCDDEQNSGGYAVSLGDPGTGSLRFYSRHMNTISLDTSTGVIQNNQWYFIAAVADITNQSRYIYIDAVERASDETDTGSWSVDVGDASIGGETASGETQNRFEGYIDEVIVFNKALSPEEISIIYNIQKTD